MTLTGPPVVPKSASFAVVAAGFAQRANVERLPIAFSTLGCPAWDLPKILDFAELHGFAAIELRGLQGNMDLPSHLAFAAATIEQTRNSIAAHGLKIACVSSSARMGEADDGNRTKELADGRRSLMERSG